MNIKSTEKKENNMIELIIEVSTEEFDSAVNDVYKKSRSKISVPGFRKGKVPRKIVEAMYGKGVFHGDALDIIAPTVLDFAISETDLKLVGYPQITDIDIKDEGSLEVMVDVAEYPEVTLQEYKGLSAYKPSTEVEESEIDDEIEAVRLRNARMEKIDRAAEYGDTVFIDFQGYIDDEAPESTKGENYPLLLGSGNFIPGFEEQLLGMVTEEERSIDVVFPEDYSEEFAGKAATFKVKLNEIREQILPDIDDEFAKDVSEFDTLEEYKANIRERFSTSKVAQSDAAFEDALMEQIIESMEADIPEIMIEIQLENATNSFARQMAAYGMDPTYYLQMTGTTPEQFISDMRVTSEKQVKTVLALNKIAELEGIEINEEDIEKEYEESAERMNMEVDKLKESLSVDNITDDIKFKRAAKVVMDAATAEDTPPPSEDDLNDADADSELDAILAVSDGEQEGQEAQGATEGSEDASVLEAAPSGSQADLASDCASDAQPQDDSKESKKPASRRRAAAKNDTEPEVDDAEEDVISTSKKATAATEKTTSTKAAPKAKTSNKASEKASATIEKAESEKKATSSRSTRRAKASEAADEKAEE